MNKNYYVFYIIILMNINKIFTVCNQISAFKIATIYGIKQGIYKFDTKVDKIVTELDTHVKTEVYRAKLKLQYIQEKLNKVIKAWSSEYAAYVNTVIANQEKILTNLAEANVDTSTIINQDNQINAELSAQKKQKHASHLGRDIGFLIMM